VSDLRLENVGKTYPGGITAVAAMDLHVRDGEFLVLVGPSGCGKSTTLRMIAGLEDPACGTIRIGGVAVNRLPPRLRDVAMVFQSHALFPHMTVRENMAFGLRRRRCPNGEIARRVAWAAELLGLGGLLDRRPHTLSGGQRQRVALGRAVVRRPKIFLFDEPLSNLDARLRTDTRAELKRLHRKLGITTLYVTHDQEEAMTLADRIAVLRGGRIQQCGAPLEVYHAPANRFVAGFIGTPPMNFIDGRLERDAAGQTWFESPCLRIPVEAGRGATTCGAGVPPAGADVALGVRPDSLQLLPASGVGKGDRSNLPARPGGCCAQIGPVPFFRPSRRRSPPQADRHDLSRPGRQLAVDGPNAARQRAGVPRGVLQPACLQPHLPEPDASADDPFLT
jgi:multiple sugar transport system ATP-binding protein